MIFVEDVDTVHARLGEQPGLEAPRDAPWGERYFHVRDPDGHELSFATPDYTHPRWGGTGGSDSGGERASRVALGEALDELREEQYGQ